MGPSWGRRGRIGWGQRGVGGGGPSCSTFSKERLGAGNSIQLGAVYDGREVCKITGEAGESVDDAFGRSAGRLIQIGVTELDGVRKK